MKRMTPKTVICSLAVLALVLCLSLASSVPRAHAEEQPAAPSPSQAPAEPSSTGKPSESASDGQSKPRHVGIGKELAKETREAEGEEKEENANLKYSGMVQKLGKLFGLDVHQAHLLALWLNFGLIAFLIFWFSRKGIPGILRARGESIQRALEEARKASQEANKRLAELEDRLRQMDVEIGKIQAVAETEAEGEEERIRKAAEEEMRTLEESAKQEIAAAAKQARRELTTYTADLAIALARKQISVDSNTDQGLVRDFAAKLAAKTSTQGNGGKDGR